MSRFGPRTRPRRRPTSRGSRTSTAPRRPASSSSFSTTSVTEGKWHLGAVPGHLPVDFGFQEYYGVLYSNDMQPLHLYRGREIETRDETERAWIGLFDEDGPRQPRGVDQRMLTRRLTDEVIAFLERLGLAESTLVVVTSDNGPAHSGSPGGLRGRKQDTYEGGMRVPMLVRWPGRVPPGSVSDAMAMNIDLFPTLLAAAGLPLPRDRTLDRADLSATWKTGAPSPHDLLFYFPTIGVEAHNLVKLHPEEAERLRSALDSMTASVRENPGGWR